VNRPPTPAIDRALMASVWQHLRNRDQRPKADLPEGRGQLRVTDEAGVVEIYLYDEIGYWGVTATDFVQTLLNIQAVKIVLHINSPGGEVWDGLAIYNALCDHPAAIEVKVDGIAASAASFIAQCGDTVAMNRGATMMVHDASGYCFGNAADMTEHAVLLDRTSDTIAGIYAARAGGTVDAWREAMRIESWYSAAEAVTAGLADTAVPEKTTAPAGAPAARFDLALTSFHFAGRAQAPRPPMPGRAPANQLPVAPTEDGPGPAAGAEPIAIPDPTPVAPAPADPTPEPTPPAAAAGDSDHEFQVDAFRAALSTAFALTTQKEAAL